MSPISGPVLAAAALVSAPALWSTLVEQTMPLDVGLTRFLVSLVVSWALISAVAMLLEVGSASEPVTSDAAASPSSAVDDTQVLQPVSGSGDDAA